MTSIRKKNLFLITGLFCIFVLFSYGSMPVHGRSVRITVLLSHSAPPYQEALEGFRTYLAEHGIQADLDVQNIEGDPVRGDEIARSVSRNGATMICTLGAIATNAILDRVSDIPVIAGMIIRADTLKERKNATGVILQFPPEKQLETIRRFLPEARTIGVLYNPAENRDFIAIASEAAGKIGLTIESREVSGPKDLPDALNSLSRNIDVLWGISDSVVYTRETAKHILLFSYRNQIPLIGSSTEWVKAGALYSLDRNYRDIGRQCGEIALKIIGGTAVSSIPVAPPREAIYTLNLKTARQMKIEFTDAIVRGAYSVY